LRIAGDVSSMDFGEEEAGNFASKVDCFVELLRWDCNE
jgi:hypothetical protein